MSATGPDPISSPPAGAGPHAEPDDREEIYFHGSPPVRAMVGKLCLYTLVGLALLAIAGLLIHKRLGPWWLTASVIVVALAVPWVPWVFAKSVRYRISNYRIDFERGLLTKNIDTLELWHVEDLHFHQSLVNRLLDVGTITIISKDDKMPMLELAGLPNPRPLYEMLKQRVIAVKRQRGVIKMDPG
ncbi:MAG: PH domain-containing protein [Tepidisphaeraceae bacterium]|jgi:membrane protein YdbS with pleckstrin-like domain